jgi:mannose-6-phosphate isomerase class I
MMKTGEELRLQFKDNIKENRAFGYVTDAQIDAYFQQNAQAKLDEQIDRIQARSDGNKQVIVVCGPGAYWLMNGKHHLAVYFDVSREYQQLQHRKDLLNFGMDWNIDVTEKYKISYFVEWPILETYRKRNLENFHIYVDMNSPELPVFAAVSDLKLILEDAAQYPLRVKPFFMPGVWGGQYLKKLADLPSHWPNCAWSFEPIAPENSMLLGTEDLHIEIPFLIMMKFAYRSIMGERPVSLFGDYFPVRLDYLDTMDGDRLSCQVHPKQAYLREKFNDFMEQQESYYIMENKQGAKVYLGLTETCSDEDFAQALVKSQDSGEAIEFADYVQEWDSEKGRLYLIPTGTVHCSGKDNLVLEISATTWWFTFKLYDYVRKDLDGNPRPINIEYGLDNVDFSKRTKWVGDHLMPAPRLLKEINGNREIELGKRQDLLFYVNRIDLVDAWDDDTEGEFVILNLVEGESVRLQSVDHPDWFVDFSFAEAYIIPADFGKFRVVNLGQKACKLIKAGVAPEWNVRLIDELPSGL